VLSWFVLHDEWAESTSSGSKWTSSTPAGFQVAFRAVYTYIDTHIYAYPYLVHTSRVLGLPIRDCAGSCSVPRCAKVSAIDRTAKTILERLHLVSGRTPIYAPSQIVPVHPHPNRSLADYFSISEEFFSQAAPHFLVSTICQVIWPSYGTFHTSTHQRTHAL